MTEFEFFTDTDFTDRSILPIFDSLEDQNDYFDAQTKIEKEGNFKGFNNPIILFEPLETCIGLSYFRFKINDKWYYAITTDVAQDTPGKTILSYRLDYWQTARYQFDIKLGRGYVNRSSHAPEGLAHRDSRYTTIKRAHTISTIGFYTYSLVYFARTEDTNLNRIGVIDLLPMQIMRDGLFNSSWIRGIDYNDDEIKAAWIFPKFTDTETLEDANWVRKSTSVPETWKYNTWEMGSAPKYIGAYQIVEPEVLFNIRSTKKKIMVILDNDGSVVYQFELGRDYSENKTKGLWVQLEISPTSAKLVYTLGSDKTEATVNPALFSISGQALDLYIDSYNEYFARQRQFDLDQRANNTQKNITNGIAGVFGAGVEGALSGALIGAAGGPIGAGLGGLLGAGISLIGTGIQAAADTNYNNPREQAALDTFYKNQVDRQSFVGSHLYGNSYGIYICQVGGLYEVEVDPVTASEIDNDIETYGEYCSIATDDGEDWVLPGALRGEFVIKGNVPESWKGEVQRNIASGVTIKKYEV